MSFILFIDLFLDNFVYHVDNTRDSSSREKKLQQSDKFSVVPNVFQLRLTHHMTF